MSRTSVKAVNKYIAKAYDRINFVMPKGRKAELQAYARSAGKSAGEWINEAILEKMERQDESFRETITREPIENIS